MTARMNKDELMMIARMTEDDEKMNNDE